MREMKSALEQKEMSMSIVFQELEHYKAQAEKAVQAPLVVETQSVSMPAELDHGALLEREMEIQQLRDQVSRLSALRCACRL